MKLCYRILAFFILPIFHFSTSLQIPNKIELICAEEEVGVTCEILSDQTNAKFCQVIGVREKNVVKLNDQQNFDNTLLPRIEIKTPRDGVESENLTLTKNVRIINESEKNDVFNGSLIRMSRSMQQMNENLKFNFTKNSILQIILPNTITRIPRNISSYFTEIRNLIIYKSSLSQVIAEDFYNMKNIQQIQLFDNKIEKIDENAFYGLKSLELLDFDRNSLKELHPLLLSHASELTIFSAAHNKLKTIDRDFFIFNKKLRKIKLNNNNFQILNFMVKPKFVHLEYYNFCGNSLSNECQNDVVNKEREMVEKRQQCQNGARYEDTTFVNIVARDVSVNIFNAVEDCTQIYTDEITTL